jgi:hypothetical protein
VESTNGHVDIGYNVIHDLPWGFATAAYVEPWGNGGYTGAPADVHDNVFHDIGWPAGAPSSCGPENNYALYIASGPDSHVYNNLIYDVGSIGIHCWHAANGMHIFNNTIANTSMGMLVGTGDGGYTVGAYYEVANNIVVNSHYGIYAEANAPGTLSTSSVFENNLVFGNDIDWGYDDHGTDTTLQAAGMAVTGTIAANPMFVSPSSGNYRLSAGSPAIAAGISQGAPDHDLDGYRRPFGAWFDIGAYESH